MAWQLHLAAGQGTLLAHALAERHARSAVRGQNAHAQIHRRRARHALRVGPKVRPKGIHQGLAEGSLIRCAQPAEVQRRVGAAVEHC
jgi:hypothetical protein